MRRSRLLHTPPEVASPLVRTSIFPVALGCAVLAASSILEGVRGRGPPSLIISRLRYVSCETIPLAQVLLCFVDTHEDLTCSYRPVGTAPKTRACILSPFCLQTHSFLPPTDRIFSTSISAIPYHDAIPSTIGSRASPSSFRIIILFSNSSSLVFAPPTFCPFHH